MDTGSISEGHDRRRSGRDLRHVVRRGRKCWRPSTPMSRARLAAIEYSPIAVVGFGYRSLEDPLDGFGLLTTTSSKQPILGVLWDSSIFPDRAPAGAKSIRAMIGGQRNPELVDQDDAGLIATARRGIRGTMGLDRDPDVTFVKRWDRGIPSYAPGPRRGGGRPVRAGVAVPGAVPELQRLSRHRDERLRAQQPRTRGAHRHANRGKDILLFAMRHKGNAPGSRQPVSRRRRGPRASGPRPAVPPGRRIASSSRRR